MGSASLEQNVLNAKSHVLFLTPFSDTSFYDVAVECQKMNPRWRHNLFTNEIIIKSLDPLRAKKKFIRKKLGHNAVSAIKASSVTL